jgi:hypothetical protein
MNYRCPLPESLQVAASGFEEFANGGAQATVVFKDGRVVNSVLVSNATTLVAARGFSTPPFEPEQIERLYQTDDDRNPTQRGGWEFWDNWK